MSFYAKSVSFWPNEWIFKYSDKIMSCKLWSKVTSVFLNINFCAKMSILGKKLNFVRNVDFFKQLCTTTESEHLIGKHAYFQKILTFCVIVYIHQETRILIKTLIFLRKCLFVHVLIFIRVFLLLENCYFDSKYDFIRWCFGKSAIFLVKFTFQVA